MALRFRKSIKLAPGIKMNLSGGGIGWTLGPRGASVGIGQRGAFLNAGIPGTGISSRTRLSGGSTCSTATAPRVSPQMQNMSINVMVDDDGNITFTDGTGNLVSQAVIDAAKKQQGDKIRELIQKKVDEINGQTEGLGQIHLHTPRPVTPAFVPKQFNLNPPVSPTLKQPGFFCKFFKSCVAKVEQHNQRIINELAAEMQKWETDRDAYNAEQRARAQFIDRVIAGELATVEKHFEESLQEIVWPRETDVDYDLRPDATMLLNIDLPEIEEMPTKTAVAPTRGFKLSVKDMGVTAIQKLYMRHIHCIGFRMIGEAFAAAPVIKTVVLGAYSQRASKLTGQVSDEYLYSVRVTRQQWENIRFDNLSGIDVVEALAAFELRRDMTKTGVFKAIQPIQC